MRLGLIGLKGHQNVVLEGARRLGNVELVAVADDSREELERFKKRQPLAKTAETYADWRQLLEHTVMDVCCVCDENHIRAEQLIALARRNIHIVTEKPLTTTLEDLERVQAALARSKSRLTMLLTMRHEAKYVKLRELVRAGAIGEVCQATAQKSYRLENRPAWFKERKRLGGTIPYIGIHALDLIRWVTGLDYTHVAAFHGRIGKPEMGETEDHASILLRMSNGASATARLDYLRPSTAPSHGDDRLRVAGTEGVIELRYSDNAVHLMTTSKKPHTIEPDPVPNLFVAFAQALEKNEPTPIPAEDCIYITEVVLRARDAADQQRMIELPSRKR
ncbi:MAG TPA: Gfo/Idh/MocA family oxidoreductase [Gemmataceae bacterium]|nr:Gfo/Idh/MocA family oxidoreductase [Gemmataceae bacterium]